MGNRGSLHNEKGDIRRLYRGKRWITCVLEFKNRHRSVMTPGQYTELFFLDEATALAAGHRPCAECRRDRFNLFREIFARVNPGFANTPRPLAPMIDDVLHRERITEDNKKRTHHSRLGDLPDGAFVTFDGSPDAYLVLQGRLCQWTPFGYGHTVRRKPSEEVRVLTPPAIVRTLQAGYEIDLSTTESVLTERVLASP